MFSIIIYVISLAAYVGILIHAGRRLWAFYKFMRALRESAKNPISTLVEGSFYAPDPVRAAIDEFSGLGFKEIGSFETTSFRGESDRLWIMTDDSTHVTILMQSYGVHISLNTVFEDKAWVQTLSEHPQGTFIDRFDYPQVRRETAKSVEPAELVKAHQSLVQTAGEGHGAALPMISADDYRSRQELWRAEHHAIELRLILRSWQQVVWRVLGYVMLLTALMVFILLTMLGMIPTGSEVWFAILIGIVVLTNLPRFIAWLKRIRKIRRVEIR